MAGEEEGPIREGSDFLSDGPQEQIEVAPWEVGSPYASSEEQIAREESLSGEEADAPRGVARRVKDSDLEPSHLNDLAVAQLPLRPKGLEEKVEPEGLIPGRIDHHGPVGPVKEDGRPCEV